MFNALLFVTPKRLTLKYITKRMSTFQDLGLNEDLLKGITDLGFEKPSEVQAKAIPILLERRNRS